MNLKTKIVMTKEERIKEVWINEIGIDAYESYVDGFVDNNGWVDIKFYFLKDNYHQSRPIREGFNPSSFLRRPKSLQGIENNNGWIKIESEYDLPKETDTYWFLSRITGKITKDYFTADSKVSSFHNCQVKLYSHYQLIQKPELPIY